MQVQADPQELKRTSDVSLLTLRTRGEFRSGIKRFIRNQIHKMINSNTKSRPYWVIEMCLSEQGGKSQIQVSFFLFAGDERRGDHQSYNLPACCAFPVCLQRHTHLAQV